MKLKKIALLALPLLMLTGCVNNPSTTSASNSTEETAKTYAITAENGTGYTITDLSATSAKRGDTITFKVNVTDDTKMISKVKYNTAELTPNEQGVYSFSMPARAVTISVELRDKPKTYTITANNGDGYTITDLSATSAIAGTAITFKVNVTDTEKTIKTVKANDIVCVKKGDLYTFDMPSQAVEIHVELVSAHTITLTQGDGYVISDLSDEKANEGKTVTFKVSVTDSLKEIDTVLANTTPCTSMGAGTYSFVMPNVDVTITISLKAATLGLDLSEAQTGYIINTLVPDQSDVFTSKGIKIYTVDSDGNPVLLTEEEMKNVQFSSPDIEDLSKPIESIGVKTIVVTYNGNSRSYEIAVGTYDVIDVDLVQMDTSCKLKVTCQYSGVSQAQFSSFNWGMDLQHNDNVDKSGWNTVIDTNNEGTDIDFTYGQNNTVGFSLDITDVENGAYTTHFGHKEVPNGNGDATQKMDLLFPTGQAKRLVIGEKAYMVQFGAFWGKGDCDITIMNASDPYNKTKRTISSIDLTKDEGKAMFSLAGEYDTYFNETLTDEDLNVYIDIAQYDVWTATKFDPNNNINDLNATLVLDKTNKTWNLSFDVFTLLKNGGEDHSWFMHIYNDGTNLEFKNLQAKKITMDDGSTIDLDFGKNLNAPSWANNVVTLKYTAPVAPVDENVKVDSLRYVFENDTMFLEVGGVYKYTAAPTAYVGDLTATGTISNERFTAKVDVSSLENKSAKDIKVAYPVGEETKEINVNIDDLADEPKLGSDTTSLFLFRTNSTGKLSAIRNTNDKFAVGKVNLEVKDNKVLLTVLGALRQDMNLVDPKFSLLDTSVSNALTSPIKDANGYVVFTTEVTNVEDFVKPDDGNTKYMFAIQHTENDETSNLEFWPADWSYKMGCEDVTLNNFKYHVGQVHHNWGDGQYRLEKTSLN